MKNLPILSNMIYCTPWCITPSAHAELSSLYQKYLHGDLGANVNAPDMAPKNLHGAKQHTYGIAHHVSEDGAMAIIYAEGVVLKKSPDMMCGPKVIDLMVLDVLLKDVAADPQIKSLVLYLDTPGGCGIGLKETSMLIDEVKASGTRVVAYTDFQVASAGYWLAASCDAIYASPSSSVGSIGAYIAAIDDSVQWEKEGLKLKLFKDGDYKAMGHPGKEWTADEEAHMQTMLEGYAKSFKDHVRSGRPGIEESTMQGQCHTAERAPVGLIDGMFRDLDACLAAEMEMLEG